MGSKWTRGRGRTGGGPRGSSRSEQNPWKERKGAKNKRGGFQGGRETEECPPRTYRRTSIPTASRSSSAPKTSYSEISRKKWPGRYKDSVADLQTDYFATTLETVPSSIHSPRFGGGRVNSRTKRNYPQTRHASPSLRFHNREPDHPRKGLRVADIPLDTVLLTHDVPDATSRRPRQSRFDAYSILTQGYCEPDSPRPGKQQRSGSHHSQGTVELLGGRRRKVHPEYVKAHVPEMPRSMRGGSLHRHQPWLSSHQTQQALETPYTPVEHLNTSKKVHRSRSHSKTFSDFVMGC
eukprot:TRINITY_DN4966_c0_g2_i1.p1 TRINITY_DN4966_c0_g2~~TRINITY_DN4966_c0_g2_i1.p1  ORF type:complete len:293 (+),score=22.20 TRINITY_DN4966_c0_g2_i1:170-1048(+)